MGEKNKKVSYDVRLEFVGGIVKTKKDLFDLIIVAIGVFIMTLNTMLARGEFILIPLLVIIPFILKLYYDYDAIILIISISVALLIMLISDDKFSYFPLVVFVICILISLTAGTIIKRFYKQNPKSAVIYCSINLIFALGIYIMGFGNPIMYMNFKNDVTKYIKDTYDGRVKIEEITIDWENYSFKNLYVANVYEDNSSVYFGEEYTIKYGDEQKFDDSYRTGMNKVIGDKVSYNLEYLLSKETEINIKDLRIYTDIDSKFSEDSVDKVYNSKDPIKYLNVIIGKDVDYIDDESKTNYYKSKEDFIKDAYKIIKTFSSLGYNVEELEIYSYIGDGDKWYSVSIKYLEGIKSIEDLEKKAIIDSQKNYEEEIILDEEEED